MSRPIKLTTKQIEEMQEKFAKALAGVKLSNGKLTYTETFTYNGDNRASVVFTSLAFAKMNMLVQQFDKEVAWHGVVFRDTKDCRTFYVSDILVYPQSVTGATVDMDEVKYATWLAENDEDDRFFNIHMQGHSHVNMGVSPSGTDETHQEEILEQLSDNSFYIFVIANKKGDAYFKIYDLKYNILYENNDVDFLIGEDGVDLAEFIKDAKGLVVEKATTSYGKNYGSQNSWQHGQKSKPKDNNGYGRYDDWYDWYQTQGYC